MLGDVHRVDDAELRRSIDHVPSGELTTRRVHVATRAERPDQLLSPREPLRGRGGGEGHLLHRVAGNAVDLDVEEEAGGDDDQGGDDEAEDLESTAHGMTWRIDHLPAGDSRQIAVQTRCTGCRDVT
jgi:hypothetical protein